MSDEPTTQRRSRDLTSGSLAWNLSRLAAPIAAHSFLQSLYGLADAFWLGRWHTSGLAAQAACSPFFLIAFALSISFGSAGTALVAQYTGAGRHREADRAAGQTLMLLAVLGLLVAGPMIALAPQALRASRVPSDAFDQAVAYLRIMMLSLPLAGFTIAYGSVLRALGDTMTVLVVGVVANVLNIVLDPVLIFGWGPFPEMGTSGAALASVAARVVEAAVCLALLRAGHSGLRVHAADLKPQRAVLGHMVRIGVPVAANRSADSVALAVFQAMVNSLGSTVVGAVTIGFRIVGLFSLPAQTMAMAAAPIVGQSLGAGKPELARRTVRSSVLLVAIVLFPPLVGLLLYGGYVARLFTTDPAVVAEAARFFRVVPASSYFFGVLTVLLAAFYGSGHTMPAMIVGVVRLWVVRLPLSWFLAFRMGWGSTGIFLGMVAGNVVCALMAVAMFKWVPWQTPVVSVAGDDGPEP